MHFSFSMPPCGQSVELLLQGYPDHGFIPSENASVAMACQQGGQRSGVLTLTLV